MKGREKSSLLQSLVLAVSFVAALCIPFLAQVNNSHLARIIIVKATATKTVPTGCLVAVKQVAVSKDIAYDLKRASCAKIKT